MSRSISRHLKAGDRHVEVDDDLGQVLQFDREDLGVPAGSRGELVVGQDIGALLVVAEMLDAESRNLSHAEIPPAAHPSVAGDDHAVLVDQNRIDEAERLQAVGDQLDLALRVGASVAGIGLEGFRSRPSRRDRPGFSGNSPRCAPLIDGDASPETERTIGSAALVPSTEGRIEAVCKPS